LYLTIIASMGLILFFACGDEYEPDEFDASVISVSDVILSNSSLSISEGDTTVLTVQILPEEATNKVVSWRSSETSVASVTQTGKVTAVFAGNTIITATSVESGRSDSCSVAVLKITENVKEIVLNYSELTITVGEKAQLLATIIPNDAINKTVSWNSSNTGVSTVDSTGVVTAVSPGSAIITVTSVDSGVTATCIVTVTEAVVPVTGVSLNNTTLGIVEGNTAQLTAIVAPVDATNKNTAWTSSNEAVATVSQTGVVTAVAVGTAVVTATTEDGGFTATCSITVTSASVPVTGISLSPTSLSLILGDTGVIAANVVPENATNKNVTWSSSNVAVATVNEKGEVTGVGGGSATITATTQDGEFTATAAVTVTVPVTGISVNPTSLALTTGQTGQVEAVITPANATNKSVAWSSSNGAVATVSITGVVTAVSPGTVVITATSVDGGFTASSSVTVTDPVVPVTGVTLNHTSYSIEEGNQFQLTATVLPANATNKNVLWSSGDESAVLVSSTGLVNAMEPGVVTITATTEDGGLTATCIVTVTEAVVPVTGVFLNNTTLGIVEGNTAQLTAITAPANATNKNTAWSSSNEAVATVSQTGLVTAVAVGTAVVTATTEDGGFTATCTITVTYASVAVTGISLNPTSISLILGETGVIAANVLPENATNKNVTWSSSNTGVATVNEKGEVTGVGGGSSTITATTQDGGFTATASVTVTVPVTGISVNPTSLALITGQTGQVEAVIEPADATNKSVAWSSSNGAVATVSITGVVTAVSPGSAVITATSVDGGFTASSSVTVIDPVVPVTGVTLNHTSYSIEEGNQFQLTATVLPANATNKNVLWSSGDESAVLVSSTGLVNAMEPGVITITATTEDGGFTATCIVTVTEAVVPATGVSLNNTTLGIVEGNTAQLTAIVAPANATNKNTTWSSSNEAVASVSQTGVVTAVAVGTAVVTATTEDGGFTATCSITVTSASVPVTGISLSPTSLSLILGETGVIAANVLPENATNKNVTWSSSNVAVATVNQAGEVTAVAGGTAVIQSVTEDGGFEATVSVTVTVPVTGISVNPTSLALITGQTGQVEAVIAPANATNKSVAWSSSNTGVATVSMTGVVTAVSPGTAVITATSVDGGFTASSSVTVTDPVVPVTGVTLNHTSYSIEEGNQFQLTATVLPANATNKNVLWSSGDESAVLVSSTGLVNAMEPGVITITATTEDGGFTATCIVTVTEAVVPVTGVSLNNTTLGIVEGNTAQLTAIVAPANATNKNTTWSSSNEAVASVNQTGVVTAVAVGTAVVTATTEDGGFTATCTITVTSASVAVTGISLNPTSISLILEDTGVIAANVLPENATNKNVTWNSSNTGVATVNEKGEVTGVGGGSSTITATTQDGGFTATAAVTVTVPVTGISVNPTSLALITGQTGQIEAVIAPANATNKSVAWSSSNGAVATVSITGVVTAVSPGSAVITATSVDGGFTASSSVTVIDPVVPVTGVTLNHTSYSIEEGNQFQLTATVLPADATNKNVLWSSGDESAVLVSSTGLVNAMEPGVVTITATTEDGGLTATCIVTVTEAVVPVTGVSLNNTTLGIVEGNTAQLTAILVPANATNKNTTWSSSNEAVATVNQTGVVTAVAVGTAVVTATTEDGGFTATCTITVTSASVAVTGISLNPTSISLILEDTGVIAANVLPENATNKNVTWSSSNVAVATVNGKGEVTGVGGGSATITATTQDGGFTATAAVTVTVPVTGISVNPTSLTLITGQTGQIEAVITPANATNKSVAWSSSNGAVATVSMTGVVTAVSPGSAVITATSVDGGFTASSSVTVTNPVVPVTGITLNHTTYSIEEGNQFQLTATVLPADATKKNVFWSSSDESAVTVNENGLVNAMEPGIVTISVLTEDGRFTATCTVTVTSLIIPVTGITLNHTTYSIEEGNQFQLTATVLPADATNKNVLWSSGDESAVLVSSTGLVNAMEPGVITITATTEDGGFTATCIVTVTEAVVPVTGVSLNNTTLGIVEGNTAQLTAIVAPANATNKNTTWSSSNEAVATVSQTGVVTAVAVGTAVVTATTEDGGFTATCTITVTSASVAVTGISLNPTSISLILGDTGVIAANVLPENATNKNVTWSSSNVAVATVNGKGEVTGVGGGSATITATTEDGGFESTTTVTVVVPVTGITLNHTTYSIVEGNQFQLVATVLPANATNKNIFWSSSDESAVTVNENGLVNAMEPGIVTISVLTEDGRFTATCTVTVTSLVIPVTGITLNHTSYSIEEGNQFQLTATVLPADATNKNVLWSSGDESAVLVSSTGLVNAMEPGVITITATTEDGGFTATCIVTVTEAVVPVTGVSLNNTTLGIVEGNTAQLTAIVAPANATNKNTTWSSSNEAVATVSQTGVVTAVAVGTAVVTATTEDGGFTATCTITVTSASVAVTGISLNPTSISLILGDTGVIAANVLPENATNKNVTWSSSNVAVATVNGKGEVTGVGGGSATITATTEDGGFESTTTVTVVVPVTGITLNHTTYSIVEGNQFQLVATVLPANATNKNIFWSSSDESAVTVNENGLVNAMEPGIVTISVLTEDGRFTATCTVTVTSLIIPVTGITLNHTTYSIEEGNQFQLTATVLPANATNKNVLWSSGDESAVLVSSTGLVNAMEPGVVTITATTEDGGLTATCVVTVTEKPIAVTGVTVSPESLSLIPGETGIIAANVLPENATNKSVAWSSNNTGVAEVNQKGEVTALAPGHAKISVFTQDGNFEAVCSVTVLVPVTGVSLNHTTYTIEEGNQFQLMATVEPEDATNKNVLWSSSDESAVTVNENGLVNAMEPGVVTITVETEDGGFTAACTVTVTEKVIPVTGVEIDPRLPMTIGTTSTLETTVLPENATDKRITWSSNNTGVATVNENGEVTAVGVGSAIVTVTTVDGGFTATCDVSVYPISVTGVTVSPASLVLDPGESAQLTATITPKDATNTNVTWSSSNSRNVSVDQNGLVTMGNRLSGGATITVTTEDGEYTATCEVSLPVSVTGITLATDNIYLPSNTTTIGEAVAATVLPANANDKSITWTSSNNFVATIISSTGSVTTRSTGTTILTATTNDGGFSAQCTLYVNAVRVTGVTLNKTTTNLWGPSYANSTNPNSEQLIETIAPSNATNKNVIWSSSDPTIATVDQNGVVTVITNDLYTQCTITVITQDGNKIASCIVHANVFN